MALKPTIYKFDVTLSDIDANRYTDLKLTVALHPSETVERMMARLLAYCLNADDGLEFTRGLSEADEPDLWLHSLDGDILKWIEVGEPSVERIRKASRLAREVLIYTFTRKSDDWWQRSREEIGATGARVVQFDRAGIGSLVDLLERTLQMSVTISGDSALVATDRATVEVDWRVLGAD